MRQEKFCPKCGKPTEKFYDNLCSDCFLKKIKMVELPEKIVVRHCRSCGKFYGSERGELSTEGAVHYSLSKILKQNKIEDATYRIEGNVIRSEITLKSEGLKKNVDVNFNLVEKEIICRFCGQKLSGYFNAILQIRGSNVEDVLEDAKTEMQRLNKRDNLAFVSKVEEVTNGFDVYVGSKSAARKVVNLLRSRYKIETKISRKQYGIQEGKSVYRDTILILLSE